MAASSRVFQKQHLHMSANFSLFVFDECFSSFLSWTWPVYGSSVTVWDSGVWLGGQLGLAPALLVWPVSFCCFQTFPEILWYFEAECLCCCAAHRRPPQDLPSGPRSCALTIPILLLMTDLCIPSLGFWIYWTRYCTSWCCCSSSWKIYNI